MESEIISIFKEKEEIKKITSRLKDYSFGQIKKHKHFEFSVMEKITEIRIISEAFNKFDSVKTIELRKNKIG